MITGLLISKGNQVWFSWETLALAGVGREEGDQVLPPLPQPGLRFPGVLGSFRDQNGPIFGSFFGLIRVKMAKSTILSSIW